MVIARSTRENIPFILERERELPPEQQTTFFLATLPHHVVLQLLELGGQNRTRDYIELAMRAGLRGWKQFPDEKGNETPFRREENKTVTIHGAEVKGPVTPATLAVIPVDIVMELVQAIVRENRITDDDAKN